MVSLGQRPRTNGSLKSDSTESAIQFRCRFVQSLPMPQSLSTVIVHVIFSTKDRDPWLGSEVRPRMHAYLATVCRSLGAEFVHIGGVADHVHIVTTLPRTVSQAQLIEEIKKVSSKWVNAVHAKQLTIFLLKRARAMVLLLRLDVLQKGIQLTRTRSLQFVANGPC